MAVDVVLRPFTGDDLEGFSQYWREIDPTTNLDGTPYISDLEDRLRYEKDGFLGPDGGRLAVIVDDNFVGHVGWHKRSNGGNGHGYCWNLGVGILRAHRGKGIGTAAQRLLIDHLFATTPVERIEAGTDAENIAEQRCLDALGFTREGVIRAGNFAQGRWRDMVLYSILREEHRTLSGDGT